MLQILAVILLKLYQHIFVEFTTRDFCLYKLDHLFNLIRNILELLIIELSFIVFIMAIDVKRRNI